MQLSEHPAQIAAPDLGLGDSTFATYDHRLSFLVGQWFAERSIDWAYNKTNSFGGAYNKCPKGAKSLFRGEGRAQVLPNRARRPALRNQLLIARRLNEAGEQLVAEQPSPDRKPESGLTLDLDSFEKPGILGPIPQLPERWLGGLGS
jgi:hypothetical protein